MLTSRHVLGVVVILAAFAAIAIADQPLMHSARTDLQKARAQLQAALANKSGHRVKAIQHVNRAIGYVNQGIAFDRRRNHAQASSEITATTTPDQPHMQAALDLLHLAKTKLEQATTDKGGYRVKAIAEVNNAIEETKKGMDAAN